MSIRINEDNYLNKIDNATITLQQDSCFQDFKKAYENENLDIMSFSFERFYSEWRNEHNYFNDVMSYQVESFR